LEENYFAAAAVSTVAAAESTVAAAESTATTAVESTAVVSAAGSLLLQEANAITDATARKRTDFFILGFLFNV
jgi:hypothetical protein